MSDREREEVEQRLLEVLLVEEHEGRGAVLDEPGEVAAARPRESARAWLAAAILLLGLGVVVAIATLRGRDRPQRVNLQDPGGPTPIAVPDLPTFVRLLEEVQSLRIARVESVGAYTLRDERGVTDMLETVAWPETHDVAAEALGLWRDALRRSCVQPATVDAVGALYQLDFTLRDGRVLRRTMSWSEREARFWAADEIAVAPDAALQEPFSEVAAAITAAHERALGVVRSETELADLPSPAARLDVPAALVTKLPELPDASGIARLTVRGSLTSDGWNGVYALSGLQELELRGCSFDEESLVWLLGLTPRLRGLTLRTCTGLDARQVRRLGGLRRLEKLVLVDVAVTDADSVPLDMLASLPLLREFGMRFFDGAPSRGHLEPLTRTKLHRLVLVGVPKGTDLLPLAAMPTLRDLVLVGGIGDRDLVPLERAAALRSLVVRNDSATEDGMADLRAKLPGLRLDWRPNGRWFAEEFAFEYAPSAR